MGSREVPFNSKDFGRRLARKYKLPAPPDNDTLRARLDVLEMLGFIERPPAKLRQAMAMQSFCYPIRLLQDQLATLDAIFEQDARHTSRRLPEWRGAAPLGDEGKSDAEADEVDREGDEDPPDDEEDDSDEPVDDDEGEEEPVVE